MIWRRVILLLVSVSFFGGQVNSAEAASQQEAISSSATEQNSQSFNQALQRLQGRDAGGNDNDAIEIQDNSANDFFTPWGSAQVLANEDGSWNEISINDAKQFLRGSVNLNTTLDMSQSFNLSWLVKIDRSAGTAIGDGLGFVLHPLYKPGENRIDSRTGDINSTLLPKYFGRLANLSAINSDPGDGNKQFLGQTIVSPGVAGGDLGMNDLMNVIGFKIDTYKNKNGMEFSNGLKTYYGANPDAGESDPDPDYSVNDTYALGSFIDTDCTGFMYYPKGTTTQWTKDNPSGWKHLNGSDNTSPKIVDGQWHQMTIKYDSIKKVFSVSIAPDPASTTSTSEPTVNWQRTLTDSELSVINGKSDIPGKKMWALSIAGSTGAAVEKNTIKNISGKFHSGEPIIMVRAVDENGKQLTNSKYVIQSEWNQNHPTETNFQDTNTQPTITANNITYKRSQVNLTTYGSSNAQTQRLTNLQQTGDKWAVSGIPFDHFKVLSYVYRRQINSSTTNPVPAQIKLQKNGVDVSSQVTLSFGDAITLKYSVTNNSGPSIWKGVTAVHKLPQDFKLQPNNQKGTGVSVTADHIIKLEMRTSNDSNILASGDSGANSATFVYQGWNPVQLTAKETTLFTRAANQPGETLQAHIYDQSEQLVDASGQPVLGSYFYQSSNDAAPLKAATSDDTDVGNHVPVSNAFTIAKDFLQLAVPPKMDFGTVFLPFSDNLNHNIYSQDKQEFEVRNTLSSAVATWYVTAKVNNVLQEVNDQGQVVSHGQTLPASSLMFEGQPLSTAVKIKTSSTSAGATTSWSYDPKESQGIYLQAKSGTSFKRFKGYIDYTLVNSPQ